MAKRELDTSLEQEELKKIVHAMQDLQDLLYLDKNEYNGSISVHTFPNNVLVDLRFQKLDLSRSVDKHIHEILPVLDDERKLLCARKYDFDFYETEDCRSYESFLDGLQELQELVHNSAERDEKMSQFVEYFSELKKKNSLRKLLSISDERLTTLYSQIKPLVWRPDAPGSEALYYTKDVDVRVDLGHNLSPTIKAEGLEEHTSLMTYHLHDFFDGRRTTAEVLAQVQHMDLENVVGFAFDREENVDQTQDYVYGFKTVLYRKI